MPNTYYTSLSGMLAASYGLQNSSNNLANLQSPGFKRSEVFYSSLGNSGVCIGGRNTSFSAGNYLETDNPADLAIVGNGFFIIRIKNGELLYTRSGEFTFDNQGLLIDKHSGGQVQGYNAQGELVAIKQSGPEHSKGKATHTVYIKGDFISIEKEKDSMVNEPKNPDPLQGKYEAVKFTVGNVYDAQGKEHKISVELQAPKSAGSGSDIFADLTWNVVAISCDDASIPFTPQAIEFDSNSGGAAKEGNNSIRFSLQDGQTVCLEFGSFKNDSQDSVRLNKKQADKQKTNIEVHKQDGYAKGKQLGFSFDDKGQISYHYDNNQSIEGVFIALANFENQQHTLVTAHDNLFRAKSEQGRQIGRPAQQAFGSIQGKRLESANVDSTTEFANIVILQRMFQACSQIMDIDKQLLEGLYKK